MKLSYRRLGYEKQKIVEAYIFVSPLIVGGLLFFVLPFLMSLRVSFSEITRFVGFQMKWAGFKHYVKAFVYDINFIPNFLGTVQFTLVNTPLIVVFSLIFAIFLNRKIRLRPFFRLVFFLPFLLGTGFVMQELLGQGVESRSMNVARGVLFPQDIVLYLGPRVYSTINGFLGRITIILWRSGVQILLYLAGLQGISPSLYESARVDGATEWECFWKITLPMISPVILLNIVYTLIDSFTDITNPLLTYIADRGFSGAAEFEYAAAMSWIYCLFIMILLGLVFAIMRPFVYTGRREEA